MKKFLSLITALAIVFSLFATVPAFAEEALTGAWNVKNKVKFVSVRQKVYFNFNRALTEEEAASIKLTTKTINWLKEDETYGGNYSTNVSYQLTSDRKSLYFYRHSSGKPDSPLATWGSLSSDKPVGGFMVGLTFSIKSSGTTKNNSINFYVQNDKNLDTEKTTIPDGRNDVAEDESFKLYFKKMFYLKYGEYLDVQITENGNAFEGFSMNPITSDTGTSKDVVKGFNLVPTNGWKKGAEYIVKVATMTKYGYADSYPSGTIVAQKTPLCRYFADQSTSLPAEFTWTFTVAGESEEEPEFPAENYVVTTSNEGNNYSISIANNTGADKEAVLVLVSKNSTTGLIGANGVKVINPITLTTAEPVNETFTINEGEVFDYYLWEKTTLIPLYEK